MKLVVVGGGITGLAAAHRAVELAGERGLALDLALLEAGDRLGGTIATERKIRTVMSSAGSASRTKKAMAAKTASVRNCRCR